MDIINTENAILKLEELGNMDPRLIVSMAVISPEKVNVAYLTDLVSLSKKARVIISGDNAGTQIKSIQYLLGEAIVVAEIVGTMTPGVRAVIKKMIQVMTRSQIMNAFFPGNMSVESSAATCFIGKTADDLIAVQQKNIKNLRVSREGLVFSDGDRVKKISLQDYKANNGFASNLFTTLLKANQEVKFLGRIKDWYVPVTFKDGAVAQLDVKSGKQEPAVKTFDGVIKTSAYIGEVFGGKHAVISGNQLVTA